MKSAAPLHGSKLESAKSILEKVRVDIRRVAGGSAELEFNIRRYVYIRLTYDERGNPLKRRLLKAKKFAEQKGICSWCKKSLELSYSHLDRKKALEGYTVENTQLLHAECHREQQRQSKYAVSDH